MLIFIRWDGATGAPPPASLFLVPHYPSQVANCPLARGLRRPSEAPCHPHAPRQAQTLCDVDPGLYLPPVQLPVLPEPSMLPAAEAPNLASTAAAAPSIADTGVLQRDGPPHTSPLRCGVGLRLDERETGQILVGKIQVHDPSQPCLLYTSPSPRD